MIIIDLRVIEKGLVLLYITIFNLVSSSSYKRLLVMERADVLCNSQQKTVLLERFYSTNSVTKTVVEDQTRRSTLSLL